MPKKNKGPDLDEYLDGKRDRYISYYDGARKYGLHLLSIYNAKN